MAKCSHNDAVLHMIVQEATTFLIKNIDANRIKCILITGSIANCEGTVIKFNSSMITSDFDFVIYLDFFYYMKNRTYFQNLSQEMSNRLVKRKIITHIDFLPSTKILRTFANPSIYEYEFALASKCIFGKPPIFNKAVRPSKRDALELVFTVVSEFVFLRFRNVSKIKESYIYAKRALTLLYSVLIFHGHFAETYEKRMKIAKEYASKGMIPLNQDEIKTLEIFTKFKLSGSFQQFLNSFPHMKINDLIRFQREFLEKLIIKILYYELLNFTNVQKKVNFMDNNFLQNMKCKFPKLLKDYYYHSKARLSHRIVGVFLYVYWSFMRDRKRNELFASFIFYKQSPKVILNILITLLFLFNSNVSIVKKVREIFSWKNFDNTIAIQEILALWQIAEESIKLN